MCSALLLQQPLLRERQSLCACVDAAAAAAVVVAAAAVAVVMLAATVAVPVVLTERFLSLLQPVQEVHKSMVVQVVVHVRV